MKPSAAQTGETPPAHRHRGHAPQARRHGRHTAPPPAEPRPPAPRPHADRYIISRLGRGFGEIGNLDSSFFKNGSIQNLRGSFWIGSFAPAVIHVHSTLNSLQMQSFVPLRTQEYLKVLWRVGNAKPFGSRWRSRSVCSTMWSAISRGRWRNLSSRGMNV